MERLANLLFEDGQIRPEAAATVVAGLVVVGFGVYQLIKLFDSEPARPKRTH